MRTHFTFLADPGHGWLIVTLGELAAVGLTEADITPYSYRHGEHLGLEEDLDAPIFLDAYKARFGREAEIVDDFGSCRGWAPFGQRRNQARGSCCLGPLLGGAVPVCRPEMRPHFRGRQSGEGAARPAAGRRGSTGRRRPWRGPQPEARTRGAVEPAT